MNNWISNQINWNNLKPKKTHEDMIKILNISGLRGCNFNVLSKHYIKEEVA
jgi:hypothetical protein